MSVISYNKACKFRYFFTVEEIQGMSPTPGGNFVKFPRKFKKFFDKALNLKLLNVTVIHQDERLREFL